MPLTTGERLGVYEVVPDWGPAAWASVSGDRHKPQAGGRIKVLPATLASDADRLARFQSEAQVLAALNHPNFARIHGLEKADGRTALVMEKGQALPVRSRQWRA